MFRNVDRIEGGPGDPRDVDEWWRNFKKLSQRVLIPLLIFVAVLILIGAILSGLDAARLI